MENIKTQWSELQFSLLKAKEILTYAKAFKTKSNTQLTPGLLIFKLIAPIFKQVLLYLVAICTSEHKAFYKSLSPILKLPPLWLTFHSVLSNLQNKKERGIKCECWHNPSRQNYKTNLHIDQNKSTELWRKTFAEAQLRMVADQNPQFENEHCCRRGPSFLIYEHCKANQDQKPWWVDRHLSEDLTLCIMLGSQGNRSR